jgi:hypothetical protein
MIVEVEVIERRFDVLADLTYIADSLGEKLQRFDIAIRSAFVVVVINVGSYKRCAYLKLRLGAAPFSACRRLVTW